MQAPARLQTPRGARIPPELCVGGLENQERRFGLLTWGGSAVRRGAPGARHVRPRIPAQGGAACICVPVRSPSPRASLGRAFPMNTEFLLRCCFRHLDRCSLPSLDRSLRAQEAIRVSDPVTSSRPSSSPNRPCGLALVLLYHGGFRVGLRPSWPPGLLMA